MLRNLGCLAHLYTHYYIISIILSFMLPIVGDLPIATILMA